MGSSFEERMAQARAEEQRVQRDLQEKKAAAEREAADFRRRRAEAASAARALLPEVRKAARALSTAGWLELEKLTKPGWWSGKPRHIGWVISAGGCRFEVSFSGLVTVSGQQLEEFVDMGLIRHYWFLQRLYELGKRDQLATRHRNPR